MGERGGEEQEALALLSKKGWGREGSIEIQQKFDFFSYDDTPYSLFNSSELVLSVTLHFTGSVWPFYKVKLEGKYIL